MPEEILSVTEMNALAQHEETIARNINSFVECGNALLEIRDKKLYRADFVDFHVYCRERWNIGRAHAYRLMEAADVANDVEGVETERQARELAPLEKELRNEVWLLAKETAPVIDGEPKVTANHIKAVREVLTGIIDAGGMDDGSGEVKSLGVLMKAHVTEHVFERMRRQEQAIIEKREHKTRSAQTAKEVPTLPAARALMSLVSSFVKGIERMNQDRGVKMHPALADPYFFGKAIIGEMTAETRLLIDDISTQGDCEGCPDEGVVITDVALTVNLNGNGSSNGLRSTRLKLCQNCVHRYMGAMAVVPEGDVVTQ
jgi:hypothetical protein